MCRTPPARQTPISGLNASRSLPPPPPENRKWESGCLPGDCLGLSPVSGLCKDPLSAAWQGNACSSPSLPEGTHSPVIVAPVKRARPLGKPPEASPVGGLWHEGRAGDKGSHSEEAAGVGPDAAPGGDKRLGSDNRRF